MRLNPLFAATKTWIETVKEYYKNNDQLTQIYMRGYFAGWSEFDILELAKTTKKKMKKIILFIKISNGYSTRTILTSRRLNI